MATFQNQATITYNGITANSNIVTGEITQVITVEKAAVSGNYAPGETVTYSVSIQNTGATPFNGLTLTDDLGAFAFGTGTVTPLTYTGENPLYYINGVLQPAPTVTAGPPLVINGINIPAGGNAVIIYRARANEFATPTAGSTISNTATVTGGGITEPIADTATITALAEPSLTILKELNPQVVAENGQITYTFTIQNTGAAEAGTAANLIVRDDFNPILNAPLTVTLNGAPLAENTGYTYNAVTGQFATVAGAVTVPAATYTQDAATGAWTVVPGVTVITVTGTV